MKIVNCSPVVSEVWDIETKKITTHNNNNIRLTVSCNRDIEYALGRRDI